MAISCLPMTNFKVAASWGEKGSNAEHADQKAEARFVQ